jgi:putative membrane protein insertion efficiency factor
MIMNTLLSTLYAAPRRGLILLVKGYRLLLSPSLGSACRFEPTCSAYALDALNAHGAAGGSYLTLRRLVRCNPWCEGGHDPVPRRLFDLSRQAPPAEPHFPTKKPS